MRTLLHFAGNLGRANKLFATLVNANPEKYLYFLLEKLIEFFVDLVFMMYMNDNLT